METVEQFKVVSSHYIVGAIGVVTALAWKDSFKSISEYFLPTGDELKIGLINAIIMTIILLLAIMILPNTIKRLPPETQKLVEENIQNRKKGRISSIT